ncbi:MAG TPA: hypothetical protein VFV52_03625, partial [Bacilli bacterium]|nr:hypothetical protein [Bacilli bacterium]
MYKIAPNAIVRREFFGGLGIILNQDNFELDEFSTSFLRCLHHTTDCHVISQALTRVHEVQMTPEHVESLYEEALESGLIVRSNETKLIEVDKLVQIMQAELDD